MSLAGKLLIAVPPMLDPNFSRTIVLVCEHSDQGALGLILNRPTQAEVVDYLPAWVDLVTPPRVVFEGGPVQREVAIGLGLAERGPTIDGWTPVTDRIGMMDLTTDPAGADELDGLRVYSGFAGWIPDQLDTEIDEGGWFVVDSEPADPLSGQPGELWRRVLSRQGTSLAIYANYPPDPSLN